MNPRTHIINEFKLVGEPVELSELKIKYEQELSEQNFLNTLLIDDMEGLTIEETQRLIKFYGSGFLFSINIEALIIDYYETRKKIEAIEKKRKKHQRDL